jgi:ribose 5-phosphate isomerase A
MQAGRRLSGDVPIAIEGQDDTWEDIAECLDDIFLGDAELRRRSFDPSANPRGGSSPVVTDEGLMLIDVQFCEGLKLFGDASAPYKEITREIESVHGVVAHGLVVGQAEVAVVAGAEGNAPTVIRRGDELPSSFSATEIENESSANDV